MGINIVRGNRLEAHPGDERAIGQNVVIGHQLPINIVRAICAGGMGSIALFIAESPVVQDLAARIAVGLRGQLNHPISGAAARLAAVAGVLWIGSQYAESETGSGLAFGLLNEAAPY